MNCGRSTLAQGSTGSGGLDLVFDAVQSRRLQVGQAVGRLAPAGWLWPETADLAMSAVAFGFAAGPPFGEASQPPYLAASSGWALR